MINRVSLKYSIACTFSARVQLVFTELLFHCRVFSILKKSVTHYWLVRPRACFPLNLRNPQQGHSHHYLPATASFRTLREVSDVSTKKQNSWPPRWPPTRNTCHNRIPVDLLKPTNVLKCQPEFKLSRRSQSVPWGWQLLSPLALQKWNCSPTHHHWAARSFTVNWSCFVPIVLFPVRKIIWIKETFGSSENKEVKECDRKNYSYYFKNN